MKKILIFMLLVLSVFFVSCKQDDSQDGPKEPVILVEIVEDSLEEVYYIDEFNITTINIEVTTDGVKEVVPLTPLLIENYTSDLAVGKNTLIINYQGIKKELVINIIEREYYTEGLEFTLNESLNAYNVVGYKGSEKEVIIPSVYNHLEVSTIKSYAFNANTRIESVYMPDTIKHIGSNAFSNCYNLKEVRISKNCVEIADAAFYLCDSLRNVTIPKSVEILNDYAFFNAKIVYTDKEDISSWSQKAFESNLVNVHTGLDLNKIIVQNDIEYYVDQEATVLNYIGTQTSIVIPDTVNDVKVTKIADAAFIQLSDLEEVTLSNYITIIGNKAFRETGLVNIEIPSSVKEIGVYAFSACESLELVTFNEGLEIIHRSAFAANPRLTHAILPDTLKTIDQYGFQNCHSLQQVYIPIGVTYVGDGAFYLVGSAKIYIEAASLPNTWHPNFSPSAAKEIYGSTRDDL